MERCFFDDEDGVLVIGINELRKMAQDFIEMTKKLNDSLESRSYEEGYEGGILDFVNWGLGTNGEW